MWRVRGLSGGAYATGDRDSGAETGRTVCAVMNTRTSRRLLAALTAGRASGAVGLVLIVTLAACAPQRGTIVADPPPGASTGSAAPSTPADTATPTDTATPAPTPTSAPTPT